MLSRIREGLRQLVHGVVLRVYGLARIASKGEVADAVKTATRALEAQLEEQRRRDEANRFEMHVLSAARSVAAGGRHRVAPPLYGAPRDPKTLRIGVFGNIANSGYNIVRCLRREGYQAELVIQDQGYDAFPLSRPFWEELPIACSSYEEGLRHESGWRSPPYVRHVLYDQVIGERHILARFGAIPEVQRLYKEAFGVDLPADRALLLAQQMAHWPALLAMKDYDVVQLSAAHISLGPFCPKPYVVLPTGGDLYTTPFEETLVGLLMRASYRGADHVILSETDYPEYLERLDAEAPWSFSPLMIDTDTYAPGSAEELRAKWRGLVGGERFLVVSCRQSFEWKGSDRLIRAFAAFDGPLAEPWRLVLLAWGQDLERSRQLVTELGLDRRVVWEPLCSKPLLRLRQQAADLAADQFVMEGYGASVLEAMAAGKAVIMAPAPAGSERYLPEPPPFFGAMSVEEIVAALRLAADDAEREKRGRASREWVEKHHGYRATVPKYVDAYRAARHELRRHEPRTSGLAPPGDLGRSRAVWEEATALHMKLRQRIMERFERSLPLADELTDRWERARYLGFGEKSSIYDSVLVLGKVKVGASTWIGPQCILDGSGGLEIGSNCSIAAGAQLYSHDTVDWAVSGGVAPYERAATRIGDACYIGPHVVVAAGSTIGRHCIVGALSLVKGDVPDHSFVGGVPARILGRVEVKADGAVVIHRAARSGEPA